MKKDELIIVADYAYETSLTLDELCQVCRSTPEFILELISYEVLIPIGGTPQQWLFNTHHLNRAKIAKRLQQDLEMNVPSIAVVLDLLEQIEDLKNHLLIFERHMK